MKEILTAISRFIKDRFSLDEDKADEALIIESIDRNVHFKGTNLWTLIFAILIASIGLNVNSTAVIIGAMLISPLMGPIMGIGLGIGIIDFDLMKRGIKNLMIAALLSIITSFLYFSLSPLHEARTEILARTTPSIWDVLIAFFGGMAGIIAGTRKEKSNILPGVAIATALMPPLCTAGFGLATGEVYYFFGAIYLFSSIAFSSVLLLLLLSDISSFSGNNLPRRLCIGEWSDTSGLLYLSRLFPAFIWPFELFRKPSLKKMCESLFNMSSDSSTRRWFIKHFSLTITNHL